MSRKCCIPSCPFKSGTIPLLPFPKRDAPNYKLWITAMQKAGTNIQQLDNPLVCAIHIADRKVRLTGKVEDEHYPTQYLTADEIKGMVEHIESLNNLVGEWLKITRRNVPDEMASGSQVKAKAKELVSIMKLFHVDIDFGWMEIFEDYVRENYIADWTSSTTVRPLRKKVKLTAVKRPNKPVEDLESITSINSNKQALEMVELLDEYVKRTKNSDGIELVTRLQEVIMNNSE